MDNNCKDRQIRLILSIIAFMVVIALLIRWKTGLTVSVIKYIFIIFLVLVYSTLSSLNGDIYSELMGKCKTYTPPNATPNK